MRGTETNCVVCGKKCDVQYCCDGRECGCYGLPIEPPICNKKKCDKELRLNYKKYADKYFKK